MSTEQAKVKLDKYVTLRGAIAHRGTGAKSCTKVQVRDYFSHVKRLVGKTGGMVDFRVKRITGSRLW